MPTGAGCSQWVNVTNTPLVDEIQSQQYLSQEYNYTCTLALSIFLQCNSSKKREPLKVSFHLAKINFKTLWVAYDVNIASDWIQDSIKKLAVLPVNTISLDMCYWQYLLYGDDYDVFKLKFASMYNEHLLLNIEFNIPFVLFVPTVLSFELSDIYTFPWWEGFCWAF